MTKYLLHQTKDGTPVGVFSEDEHYYLPTEKAKERYGIALVATRGPETSWEDFMEQQASRWPGPNDMWDIYDSDEDGLEFVLDAARTDTTYGD